MNPKVVRLPPSEIKKKYNKQGDKRGYSHYPEDLILRGFVDKEEGIIYLEEGADKVRELHEVWHFQHPHEEDLKPVALVDNELRAELYALKKARKSPNSSVGIPAMASLLADYSEGYTPGSASKLVVQRLRKLGVNAPPEWAGWLSRRFGG